MGITLKHRFIPFESPSWSRLVNPESETNRDTRIYFANTVDMSRLPRATNPKSNLKLQHTKIREACAVATLVCLITTIQASRQLNLVFTPPGRVAIQIQVADIPRTQQFRKPPPPVRPSVPIPTEDETIPVNATIARTDLDLTEIPPPPPPPEERTAAVFVAYDEPPEIIGGLAELQKHLEYPLLAVKSRIEGIVYVNVLVGIDGTTEQVRVVKARPANLGFEESALNALKKIKWQPAKQRDKKIRVLVTIPVQFALEG